MWMISFCYRLYIFFPLIPWLFARFKNETEKDVICEVKTTGRFSYLCAKKKSLLFLHFSLNFIFSKNIKLHIHFPMQSFFSWEEAMQKQNHHWRRNEINSKLKRKDCKVIIDLVWIIAIIDSAFPNTNWVFTFFHDIFSFIHRHKHLFIKDTWNWVYSFVQFIALDVWINC